ncbi:hypothetical protein [uncultured Microscilla sp.]|uniref:hypothetical protein n=1 Tax=uncultured Microscilla sp. TaxID=432653 RepID=UPI00262F4863|nr:hypothetical protein [uncultured Microscilla sp.]
MNHTPQEQKAQKLWAKYECQNEGEFWERYDSLVREANTTELPTYITQQKIPVTQPSASASVQKSPVYSNLGERYLATVTMSGLVAILVFSNTNVPEWGGIFFGVWLVFLLFALSKIFNYPSFRITPSKLIVYKAFNQEEIQWSKIDHIVKQEEIMTEEGNSFTRYFLIINTYYRGEYKVFTYNYGLSGNIHSKFFEHLRQYLPNVREKKAEQQP